MSDERQVEDLCKQARTALRSKDYEAAAKLYDQAIEADGRCVPAHEGRANVAFHQKDYDTAIDYFKRIQRIDPRKKNTLINLGAVYNRAGKHKDAILTLQKGIAKDRTSAEAYYNLGIAHRALNQNSMAVTAYKEAIRLQPKMAEAYNNIANAYTAMGNTRQAITNFEKALEIKPDFKRAKDGLLRVQDRAELEKSSVSPFGRLIDASSLSQQMAAGEANFMNQSQRSHDREEVYRLSKEVNEATESLLKTLAEQLNPNLTALSHLTTSGTHSVDFVRAVETFEQSQQALVTSSEQLRQTMTELRDHESLIKQLADEAKKS